MFDTDWRKPQPSDGPDYHADLAYWVEHNTRDDAVERAAEAIASWLSDTGVSDAHREAARAALAAARAGEAEATDCGAELATDDGWITCNLPAGHDRHETDTGEFWTVDSDDGLAAQRGGEAVDREALIQAAMPYFSRLWALNTTARQSVDAVRATVNLALAARGDAAPTEVEWGVREHDGAIFSCGTGPAAEFHTQNVVRAAHPDLPATRVQRTVSAWREVPRG